MWVLGTEPESWQEHEYAKHGPSLQPLVRVLATAAGGTLTPPSVPNEH